MVMSINTNVAANKALASLRHTQDVLQKTQMRVSTGLRVSEAKDDSASYVIAQKMNSDIAAYRALKRGIDFSMSTVGTATKAAESVKDLLIQIREKTVDAQKSGLKDSDRQALQDDIDNLKNTINVLIGAADHNGTNLIDGSGKGSGSPAGRGGQLTGDSRLIEVTEDDKNILVEIVTKVNDLKEKEGVFTTDVAANAGDIDHTGASVSIKDIIDGVNDNESQAFTTQASDQTNLSDQVQHLFGRANAVNGVTAQDAEDAAAAIKDYFEKSKEEITEILQQNTAIKQEIAKLQDDDDNSENLNKIIALKASVLSDTQLERLNNLKSHIEAQLNQVSANLQGAPSYQTVKGETLNYKILDDDLDSLSGTAYTVSGAIAGTNGIAARQFIADIYNSIIDANKTFDEVKDYVEKADAEYGKKYVEYEVTREEVDNIGKIQTQYGDGDVDNAAGEISDFTSAIAQTQQHTGTAGVLAYTVDSDGGGPDTATGMIQSEYNATKTALEAISGHIEDAEQKLSGEGGIEERFEEFKQKFGHVDQGPAEYKELALQMANMKDKLNSLKNNVKLAQELLKEDWSKFDANDDDFEAVTEQLAGLLGDINQDVADDGHLETTTRGLAGALDNLKNAMEEALHDGGVLKGTEFKPGHEYVGPGSHNPVATVGSMGVLANINPDNVEEVKILAFDITEKKLGIENIDVLKSAEKAHKSVVRAIEIVTAVLASLGSSAKQLEIQSKFTKGLMEELQAAVGAMVDTDIAEESAKLTALQTKKQFGIKSLSIANSSSRDMLALFQN